MANKVEQQNKKLVKASARNLRISPRKMRLVTNLVKNMKADEAITQLQFVNKKGAPMVIKLLQSAIANAVNNFSLNASGLFIKSITTDMGSVMKRTQPRARGSAFIIRRKMSHVNVILEEREVKAKSKGPKAAIKKVKKEEPVQTQEGSLGLAEETETKTKTASKAPKELHRENFEKVVDKKNKPTIVAQRGQGGQKRTTNK